MKYIAFILLLISLNSCSTNEKSLVINSGLTQGTEYYIEYISNNGKDYQTSIDSILHEVDSSLSTYKDYSLISELNKSYSVKVDDLFVKVFKKAKEVYKETNGYFDCSVNPLVDAWGFYETNFDTKDIDSTKISDALNNIGFDKISLIGDSVFMQKNMKLDFNAIAQGYTVDLIANFLQKKGIHNYLINVGGELIAKGKNEDGKIWSIGIDKPSNEIDNDDRFIQTIYLRDMALATSGNYRKFYVKDGNKYSHIINPITGFPSSNRLLSVTVVHKNCMTADAYATAFMTMGLKSTKKFLEGRSDMEVFLVYNGLSGEWKTFASPKLRNRFIN